MEAELARRIVAAAPRIDAEAEAELYRRLAPRVRLYGRRHLRDDDAAHDLMQQVMVFGMCRMVTMELRRGARRREALLEEFGADLTIADIAIAPRLDEAKVTACLERLAERERSVLLLSFYEEEPADKVGEMLGLSAGNVRVIRHRAIERLRACVLGAEKT